MAGQRFSASALGPRPAPSLGWISQRVAQFNGSSHAAISDGIASLDGSPGFGPKPPICCPGHPAVFRWDQRLDGSSQQQSVVRREIVGRLLIHATAPLNSCRLTM